MIKMNSLNGINVKKVLVGSHAIKRARERGHWDDKLKDEQIRGNVRSLLGRAKRVCNSIDEEGNPSILFAVDKYEIHLSTDLQTVKTIIKQDKITYKPIQNKVFELIHKEIRKLERKENARIRYLNSLTYDCQVEIAELNRRIFRTKSITVKQSCEARIAAINHTIKEYQQEIKEIQDEKRRISRALVAVI